MAIINQILAGPAEPLKWSDWQEVPIPNPAAVNLIALQVLGNTGIIQIGLGDVGKETIWDTLDQFIGGTLIPTFNGRVALRIVGDPAARYRAVVLA